MKSLVSWPHFVISSDLFLVETWYVWIKWRVSRISISCCGKGFPYKQLPSWWCAIWDCGLCCCPLIPTCAGKVPWHGSILCHWKRVCGCWIIWNCFLLCRCKCSWIWMMCRNSGLVDNIICEAFTSKLAKFLIYTMAHSGDYVSLIALIQDLLVVVFVYVSWTTVADFKIVPANILWSLCDFGKCLSIK